MMKKFHSHQIIGYKRSTTMSTVPKWDLALVLSHLTQPPYEPMHLATPNTLTYKTVFLLGLA